MQSNDSKYCNVIILIFQYRHTVKEFQVLLINTSNYIHHHLFVCLQLNGFKHCYISLTVQLNISYTLLNDQTVLFITVQFSISHLFTRRLNVKQFYLTYTEDRVRVVLGALASPPDSLASYPGHSFGRCFTPL